MHRGSLNSVLNRMHEHGLNHRYKRVCMQEGSLVQITVHSETQICGGQGMFGDRFPRHAQNPLSGERRKTISITYHALSPSPSHHHLYIIYLINGVQRFYRITMSLKRPFMPNDVKQ